VSMLILAMRRAGSIKQAIVAFISFPITVQSVHLYPQLTEVFGRSQVTALIVYEFLRVADSTRITAKNMGPILQ
jgi:hypothetical protein